MSEEVCRRSSNFLSARGEVWRASLLDKRAYDMVVAHQAPLRYGLMLLLMILLSGADGQFERPALPRIVHRPTKLYQRVHTGGFRVGYVTYTEQCHR